MTTIQSVKHGVTEINLSDGRQIRATLHIQGLEHASFGDLITVSYQVVTEIMKPIGMISEIHETVQ